MGKNLRGSGARSGGIPPTPRAPSRPRLSKTSERAVRNASTLQSRGSIGAGEIAILLNPNSGYMAIAEALVKSQRRHLSRGHVLCDSLNATAEAWDPATYTLDLRLSFEKLLLDAGMKPWIAQVLAATSLKTMLAAVGDRTAQLRLTLRSLIVLACPDLELCPAIDDISKAFLAPLVADELRAGAAALRSRS